MATRVGSATEPDVWKQLAGAEEGDRGALGQVLRTAGRTDGPREVCNGVPSSLG